MELPHAPPWPHLGTFPLPSHRGVGFFAGRCPNLSIRASQGRVGEEEEEEEGREEEVQVAVVTRSGQRHTPSSDDEPQADAPTILRPPTERPIPPQIFPPLRFTFKQPLKRLEEGESAQPAESNLEVLGQVNAEGPLRRSRATRPKSKVPWVGKEGRQDSIEESAPIRAGPSLTPTEGTPSLDGEPSLINNQEGGRQKASEESVPTRAGPSFIPTGGTPSLDGEPPLINNQEGEESHGTVRNNRDNPETLGTDIRVGLGVHEEQWAKILHDGFIQGKDGKIHVFIFSDDGPPVFDLLVELDHPLCFQDGIQFVRDPDSLLVTSAGLTPDCIIPIKYIASVTDRRTDVCIFPEIPGGGGYDGDGSEPGDPPEDRPDTQVRFHFQSQLPPEERTGYLRARNGAARRPFPNNVNNPPVLPRPVPIMEQDWAESYKSSPGFRYNWEATHDTTGEFPWPSGVRLQHGKMYWGNLLCVPEDKVGAVTAAYHSLWGHIGINRMVQEIKYLCVFPPGYPIDQVVKKTKRQCQVCQQTEPPNWEVARKQNMCPVPDRIFSSVCIDIFSMQPAEWQGVEYDAMLLCVDRLSGWIVTKCTRKLGLTAEKAAHLMLDDGWDIYGIPHVVTSDQGPQFAGMWWKTMCIRLGIRQAFSQAHRPQSNGRAERAGKQIIDLLRKMHAEQSLNWEEALPMALRIHHDNPGPSGWSPYEIVFGRKRALMDLPHEGTKNVKMLRNFSNEKWRWKPKLPRQCVPFMRHSKRP